jgi:site-specific DNA-methyltransferase (adenine-specific)
VNRLRLVSAGGAPRLPRNRVVVGDAAQRLRELPADSIDCVVTSPPYFALRDYGEARQLGREASVDGWVANLLTVADELARVLKSEGSLWLNLGDSYSRHPRYGAPRKGLVLAPERLLLALAERGWLVRNKIVWAKPNPMPASVGDRLGCTWEPLYLLTRAAHYYFDLDAIRVPHTSSPSPRRHTERSAAAQPDTRPPAWAGPLAGNQSGLAQLKAAGLAGHPLGKNPGDVWRFGTSSHRGGHHATFPEALVERPLLAGCPERVCTTCGSAWRRAKVARRIGRLAVVGELASGCECRAGWQPGVVLDPFLGSGTTAVVAERLGRDWVGIELNPDFAAIAERRVATARGRADPTAKAA